MPNADPLLHSHLQAAPAPKPAAVAAPTPAALAAQLAAAKLEKPEDAVYTVPVPEGLTMLELDTIKLTAQVGGGRWCPCFP